LTTQTGYDIMNLFRGDTHGKGNMLFKALNTDGNCYRGGHGKWSLPTKNDDGTWLPGDWMPAVEGKLIACKNGYHACREGDLLKWLGPAIFDLEYRGDRVDADDKIIVREARLLRRCENWNERTARLFACDCAERVLPIYKRNYHSHKQLRRTIATVRRFADGAASLNELKAGKDAAYGAAKKVAHADTASWNVARAVSWAATINTPWDTAIAASQAVAWDISLWDSHTAVWRAARDAEQKWQTAYLLELLV